MPICSVNPIVLGVSRMTQRTINKPIPYQGETMITTGLYLNFQICCSQLFYRITFGQASIIVSLRLHFLLSSSLNFFLALYLYIDFSFKIVGNVMVMDQVVGYRQSGLDFEPWPKHQKLKK